MRDIHVEKNASKYLEVGYEEAKMLLSNPDKMSRFLSRMEKKLEELPEGEPRVAGIPILASLLKSYVEGSFTDCRKESMLAVVSALYYVVSPFDLIPDRKSDGYDDDGAIADAARDVAAEDIEKFLSWQKTKM